MGHNHDNQAEMELWLEALRIEDQEDFLLVIAGINWDLLGDQIRSLGNILLSDDLKTVERESLEGVLSLLEHLSDVGN